jgi:hypothetical protein
VTGWCEVKSVRTGRNKPDTLHVFCNDIAEVVAVNAHDFHGPFSEPGHEHVTATPSRLIVLVLVASGLASCSKDAEYSDQQRACIARRYTAYDASKRDQCVDVCIACMNGNAVTCNTSCKLRGAS